MFRLILASCTAETDAPDLVIVDFSTTGELLEAVAEQGGEIDQQLRDLDDWATLTQERTHLLTTEDDDITVTFGCVVRL